jgi:predicted exporter
MEQVNQQVADHFSRRVILLIGDPDPAKAHLAATQVASALAKSDLLQMTTAGFTSDQVQRMGALYYPYRRGLLADQDRGLLLADKGGDVASRALAQIYGVAGMVDAKLIIADPFLLLPSFLIHLPVPLSRLTLQDGLLTTRDAGVTWILLSGYVNEPPFSLDLQKRLTAVLEPALADQRQKFPELQVRRLGAVFFAEAGSQVAMRETSMLGTLSTIGSALLLLMVFRRFAPLWQNLLVIGIGAGAALSLSLLLFEQLHVAVLLFGVSLIGIAVDYGMYYYSCLFDPTLRHPSQRLDSVMAGIGLGYITTVLGYAVLILAPFPGLRQIAIFSLIGLSAAFVSVVLWFPLLDRARPLRHGRLLLQAAEMPWRFWESSAWRPARGAFIGLFLLLGVIGCFRLRADDDVRHMQSLSTDLVRQQADVLHLIGSATASQFLLIHVESDEAALQREETLAPVLTQQIAARNLTGYQVVAAFVPSAKRQAENRQLVTTQLEKPFLAQQRQQLGLPAAAGDVGTVPEASLTLDGILGATTHDDILPFLRELILAPGIHIVTLDDLKDASALRQAIAGFGDVRLMDPASDYTLLLGKYRQRAVWLIALSIVLMMAVLIWRYGWRGALRVKAPSVTAIIAATACIGLMNEGFTFFHVMALILVQSIGVDYAVFCAECAADKRPVTMLGVWLSALSTILSFGVLALSQVAAVHAFGLTMLVGIIFAFFLAPLAGGAVVKRRLGRVPWVW